MNRDNPYSYFISKYSSTDIKRNDLLYDLAIYLARTVSYAHTSSNIAKALTSDLCKVERMTITRYISCLVERKLIVEVPREALRPGYGRNKETLSQKPSNVCCYYFPDEEERVFFSELTPLITPDKFDDELKVISKHHNQLYNKLISEGCRVAPGVLVCSLTEKKEDSKPVQRKLTLPVDFVVETPDGVTAYILFSNYRDKHTPVGDKNSEYDALKGLASFKTENVKVVVVPEQAMSENEFGLTTIGFAPFCDDPLYFITSI